MVYQKRSLLSIMLLKPSLQFRYIAVIFFAILFVCIAIGVHFHFAVVKHITVDLGYPELTNTLTQMNIIMVCLFLSYSFIVLVFAVLISHKFAGPIYRFEKIFEEIGNGNLSGLIELRKGDELLDFKDHLNVMITRLKDKITQDRTRLKSIDGILESLAGELSQQQDARFKECARQIAAARADVNNLTRTFTV